MANDTAAEKAQEKPWTVKSADGNKTFFSGTEDDAYAHVEANFPRMHVEPGQNYDDGPQPDVYVFSGDGKKQYGFDGNDWLEYTD